MNIRILSRLVLAMTAVLIIAAQNQPVQAAGQSYRVLFIGNSHTYLYNMPGLFSSIASNGQKVSSFVSSSAYGGYTLMNHLFNETTMSKIDSGYDGKPWDYVILQEHTWNPPAAEIDLRFREEFQSATAFLYSRIKSNNPDAKVILFENYAWHERFFATKDPDDHWRGENPTEMQARIRKWTNDTAYNYVPTFNGGSADMIVSPIGDAWERNYANPNAICLHVNSGDDYYHPNLYGTYLGALTMYKTIFNASPLDITYNAAISASTANYLRGIAAVPEPSSFLCLLTGIGTVAGTLRLRKR